MSKKWVLRNEKTKRNLNRRVKKIREKMDIIELETMIEERNQYCKDNGINLVKLHCEMLRKGVYYILVDE